VKPNRSQNKGPEMETAGDALKKITDYYETQGMQLWDIITQGQIHLGYWDNNRPDDSFAQATRNLTQLMIGKTQVSRGDLFCDLGCGVGMPAIRLAAEKGCTVHGVTLSPLQKEWAQKNAAQNKTGDQTLFFTANALDLPFEDNSYDGGWFFESIFHMGHEQALAEAGRVLKPGAHLVIADLVDIGIMTDEERTMAKDICNAAYITKQDYPGILARAGFELTELTDITRQVMDLFEKRYSQAIEDNKAALLKIVDEEFLKRFETIAGQLVKTAGYVIVTAKKT